MSSSLHIDTNPEPPYAPKDGSLPIRLAKKLHRQQQRLVETRSEPLTHPMSTTEAAVTANPSSPHPFHRALSTSPSSFPPLSPSPSPHPPACEVAPAKPRVPRPTNAFLIYRSELIKSRKVPSSVEHRQQNISRLAGECWQLLSPKEKDVYREKAERALAEHQRLYPDYKYSPGPRNSKDAKSRARRNTVGLDDIRHIRETYVKIVGPSKATERTERRRKERVQSCF